MPIENGGSRLNIHTDRKIFGITTQSSDANIIFQKGERAYRPIGRGFDKGYLSIKSGDSSNIDIEVYPNNNSNFNKIQYYLIWACRLVAITKINSLSKRSEPLTVPHFLGCTDIVVTLI